MGGLRDEAHRVDEARPGFALAREYAATFRGQRIEAAAPLAGLLDPAALQPAALLQPIQQRVQRSDVKADAARGAVLDQLADLVAVSCACLDDRKDDQLRRALLAFAIQR